MFSEICNLTNKPKTVISFIFIYQLVFTRWNYNHWNVCMVYNITADTSKYGASNGSQASPSHDNQWCFFFFGYFDDVLTNRWSLYNDFFPLELKQIKNTKLIVIEK